MSNVSEKRVPFDLRLEINSKEAVEFDFELTESERQSFYDLADLGDIDIYGYLTSTSTIHTLTIYCKGDVNLEDVHDHTIRPYHVDDSVEVVLAPGNPDDADITPDDDGIYDVRGCILALLYDCIPTNYSEVPLETVVTDDYILMSEEEYEKSRHSSSPFDCLNSEDFE